MYRYIKRCADIIGAGLGLILLSPVLLVVAIMIKVQMGSPVIFTQIRPGLYGKPFKMYKFRTMLNKCDEKGNLLPDKERITKIGSFLRKSSIDELPELWNVLKGDMSLVGPRPLLMQYLDRYTPEQARRHEVKPGITGWAQVNGRNAITWEEKFTLDVWYVDNWSLWLDIKIWAMTVVKVFRREGISAAGEATVAEFRGMTFKEQSEEVERAYYEAASSVEDVCRMRRYETVENLQPLVIIGASGFGREVANIVEAINGQKPTWNLLGLIDDKLNGKTAEKINILGTVGDLLKYNEKPYVAIAIADSTIRRQLAENLEAKGFKFATLIDPSARIGKNVNFGEGTIICVNTVFTTNINLGKHCIINNLCSVGHDTNLGDYVSVMSHSVIAGNVNVGEGCYFGLTCTVINLISIGRYCIIGAGATVVNDIPDYSVAVGVPARVIKRRDMEAGG